MTAKNLKVQIISGCQPVFFPPPSELHRGISSCSSRQRKRGSTYRACLLEVSIFCRRSLHNTTCRGGKSLLIVGGGRGVLVQGWMEKRAHLRRLSGGSGCDNDTVVVSRLHRCMAETTASTAAALSRQPTTYLVDTNTMHSGATYK